MTINEAKESIKEEYIESFHKWLDDHKNLSEDEKSIIIFQEYIASGRYVQDWIKAGYDANILHELCQEGFLSYQMNCGQTAIKLHKVDFYYLNQNTVKQIYRELKRR